MKRIPGLPGLVLLLMGCGTKRDEAQVASTVSGCSVQLTASQAHLFLAEFSRSVEVRCGSGRATVELEVDPGGLGRVEVRQRGNALAIVDAFQVTWINASDARVLSRDVHTGKLEHYEPNCANDPVFEKAEGVYMGAFDYCADRWRFVEP